MGMNTRTGYEGYPGIVGAFICVISVDRTC